MATQMKALALSAGLMLTGLLAAIPPANANDDRHGITIARPATPSDLRNVRPRGLFFSDADDAYDYNSYSYDDRYHGPSPSYRRPYSYAPYYFAPAHPLYRYSTGGTLHYWPRANYPR